MPPPATARKSGDAAMNDIESMPPPPPLTRDASMQDTAYYATPESATKSIVLLQRRQKPTPSRRSAKKTKQTHCTGLTIDFVVKKKYYRTDMRTPEQKAIKEEKDNKILTDGFCHLVGNAMVQNGFIVSHQLESYLRMDDPLVYGAVKKNILHPDVLFVCKKISRPISLTVAVSAAAAAAVVADNTNNNNNNNNTNDDGKTPAYAQNYSFYTPGCTKDSDVSKSGVCLECSKKKDSFKRKLKNEVAIRDGPLDPKVNDVRLMISPGLMRTKIRSQKTKINTTSHRVKRQKEATKRMAELAHQQIQLVVKNNKESKKIFDDDTKKLAADFFSTEKVSEDNLMRYDVVADIVLVQKNIIQPILN